MTGDTASPSPTMVLAASAYLLVAALGVTAFLFTGNPDLVVLWLGLVGAGGIGGALFRQIGTVAHTLGTHAATNGDNVLNLLKHVAAVEEYSHTKSHEHGNALSRIEAKVDLNKVELHTKLDALSARLEALTPAQTNAGEAAS